MWDRLYKKYKTDRTYLECMNALQEIDEDDAKGYRTLHREMRANFNRGLAVHKRYPLIPPIACSAAIAIAIILAII